MTTAFVTSPAHMVVPGTAVDDDGVVFSTVFRNCASCGLILYRLADLEEIVLPFTDEYRYGSLYSVRVHGIRPEDWAYRYYRDNYTFEDPYARELIELETAKGKITAGRLFPRNEDQLPAYGRKTAPWPDQYIYVLHVKGFTASRTSKAAHRGTFRGVAEKIPYLKKLGVTAVELLPVYELREAALGRMEGAPVPEFTGSMAGDVARFATSPYTARPLRKDSSKMNYWNFGEGCYFAPKRAYAASGKPQQEFREMVDAFHKAGILVYLQLFFPDTVSIQTQQETARFYVTHYHVDGFHLKGGDSALKTLATDPMLSDTAIFYYGFPYEDLQKEDKENPTVGRPSISHLSEYRDDFEPLVRQFVKSDNNVVREFTKRFVTVPVEHGEVHYVCNYDGFTLMDLVSYNWKHNEDNGENDRDGTDQNYSWNCGIEGKSQKKDIRTLRIRQIKNFLTLNFLAQGTPVLHAGDERCNSQNGNNNPYCQDNEIGWMQWKDTVDAREILHFTEAIAAFRREHSIFRRRTPFRFNDDKVSGYPDISFHGKDAYKPDFSSCSHTIGILYNESYAEENPDNRLLYLAINMHWHNQLLGIPQPPKGYQWFVVMDTFRDKSFPDHAEALPDQRRTAVPGRSIQILEARPAAEGEEPVQARVYLVKSHDK